MRQFFQRFVRRGDKSRSARAEVDPEKMERVLLNLLSNAFKFTPQGGRIQCTLKVNDGRFILTVTSMVG